MRSSNFSTEPNKRVGKMSFLEVLQKRKVCLVLATVALLWFSNSAIPFPFDRSNESVGPRKSEKTWKEQKTINIRGFLTFVYIFTEIVYKIVSLAGALKLLWPWCSSLWNTRALFSRPGTVVSQFHFEININKWLRTLDWNFRSQFQWIFVLRSIRLESTTTDEIGKVKSKSFHSFLFTKIWEISSNHWLYFPTGSGIISSLFQ